MLLQSLIISCFLLPNPSLALCLTSAAVVVCVFFFIIYCCFYYLLLMCASVACFFVDVFSSVQFTGNHILFMKCDLLFCKSCPVRLLMNSYAWSLKLNLNRTGK